MGTAAKASRILKVAWRGFISLFVFKERTYHDDVFGVPAKVPEVPMSAKLPKPPPVPAFSPRMSKSRAWAEICLIVPGLDPWQREAIRNILEQL